MYIPGPMADHIQDNGKIINPMEKVLNTTGKITSTPAAENRAKNMAKEHLSGQTVENILVIGTKENNTVWEFT